MGESTRHKWVKSKIIEDLEAFSSDLSRDKTVASFDRHGIYLAIPHERNYMSISIPKTINTGGSVPSYDPNKVNQITANFLDPSKLQLGQSGGGGSGFNPDQFNSQSFSFFNPSAMVGKRRGTLLAAAVVEAHPEVPQWIVQNGLTFDPNKVNQITANFLDPSKLQLGPSGGGGGGFDPDQFNSQTFNFFNPSALMGKRRGTAYKNIEPPLLAAAVVAAHPEVPQWIVQNGLTFDPNKVNQITANFLDPSKLQLGPSGGGGGGFDPDQFNSQTFNFFNPSALMGKRRGTAYKNIEPPLLAAAVVAAHPEVPQWIITANFLDPSKLQLGPSGGGGGGFDPDSQFFNYFNPSALMGKRRGTAYKNIEPLHLVVVPAAAAAAVAAAADPEKLGASNGAAGGFDPDQFNTQNFNFFNPQSQSGGGGGGGSSSSSGSAPKFDANKVNQLQTNFLDPSTSKLGQSGGAAGGFDPDQYNSQTFNFFNPQAQVGR
ncbi:hypothetical protein DPMN_099867 [Dreissena polymorpha]|uniref:Uncharacterized protein n=1 Tax=Dreissena polymorpha TaxID=45954 RepID=A0A9D4LI32_DREPO|nr:hypothetical protein DPMN_099867 [Dreissena polymorpha]